MINMLRALMDRQHARTDGQSKRDENPKKTEKKWCR